jgi:hypothetical protein
LNHFHVLVECCDVEILDAKSVRWCVRRVVDLLLDREGTDFASLIRLVMDRDLIATGSFEPRLAPLDKVDFRNPVKSLLSLSHFINKVL